MIEKKEVYNLKGGRVQSKRKKSTIKKKRSARSKKKEKYDLKEGRVRSKRKKCTI